MTQQWGHYDFFGPINYLLLPKLPFTPLNQLMSTSFYSFPSQEIKFYRPVIQTMQPSDFTEHQYLGSSHLNQYADDQYATDFGLSQNNTYTIQGNRFSNPLYHLQVAPQVHELKTQMESLSNNSSDETDGQQKNLINERKQRRMISNRESARRSRMRKQRHLDELWSQVVWLRTENYQLVDKLNHMSESQNKVLKENAQLKELTSELRQRLTDMQLSSSCPTLHDLDDIPDITKS